MRPRRPTATPRWIAPAPSATRRADCAAGSSSPTWCSSSNPRAAARRQDMPVVIVNDGPTRADAEAALRVHGRLEDVLADWAAIVGVQDPGGPPQRAGEVR